MIVSKLHKWGNSYVVIVPSFFVKFHNLGDGTPLQLDIQGDSITLKPISEEIQIDQV